MTDEVIKPAVEPTPAPTPAPATVVPPAPVAPPEAVPDETGANLRAHVGRIRKRIAIVTEIFKDDEYTPFNSRAFKKFIVDTHSESAMRFILMGLTALEESDTEDVMRRQGFTVSGTAPDRATGKEQVKEGFTAPSVDLPQENTGILDDSHPLIQQAMELGFDPNRDPED